MSDHICWGWTKREHTNLHQKVHLQRGQENCETCRHNWKSCFKIWSCRPSRKSPKGTVDAQQPPGIGCHLEMGREGEGGGVSWIVAVLSKDKNTTVTFCVNMLLAMPSYSCSYLPWCSTLVRQLDKSKSNRSQQLQVVMQRWGKATPAMNGKTGLASFAFGHWEQAGTIEGQNGLSERTMGKGES